MKNKKTNKDIMKNAQKAILRFTHDKDQFMSLIRETKNFELLCGVIERIQKKSFTEKPYEPITLDFYEAVLVGAVLSMLRDELYAAKIDADIQKIKAQTKEFD